MQRLRRLVADLPWNGREQYYRVDFSKYRHLERIFEDRSFDYVYYLGVEFGRKNGEDFYETMWHSNAVGTKNMLRLQQEHDFRMIYSSSSEVYGDYDSVKDESVPHEKSIHQLNDYAISKWVNEMQILNSADRPRTETVRVHLFNTYGPSEHYSEYRSVVARFCYRALQDEPYHVYEDHHRSFTYVGDTVETLANLVDNFRSGEVYNIASTDYRNIKDLSEMILNYLGKDDSKVEYRGREEHNTLNKKASIERAKRDLDHNPSTTLEKVDPEHTDLITTACRVNNLMPGRAARMVRRLVAEYSDPDTLALGIAYKPNTYDQRNSPARAIVEDLQLDGYSVDYYDRDVPGEGYDDLQRLVQREDSDVIVQLVGHDETVEELDGLLDWLDDRGILAARFEGASINRLTAPER